MRVEGVLNDKAHKIFRGTIDFIEGCLSAPNKHKKVSRAQKVWCDYMDENGDFKQLAEGGLCSVICNC